MIKTARQSRNQKEPEETGKLTTKNPRVTKKECRGSPLWLPGVGVGGDFNHRVIHVPMGTTQRMKMNSFS